jgi:hypothetical protein
MKRIGLAGPVAVAVLLGACERSGTTPGVVEAAVAVPAALEADITAYFPLELLGGEIASASCREEQAPTALRREVAVDANGGLVRVSVRREADGSLKSMIASWDVRMGHVVYSLWSSLPGVRKATYGPDGPPVFERFADDSPEANHMKAIADRVGRLLCQSR